MQKQQCVDYSSLSELDNSQNELNIGFIADDSRQMMSDSQSYGEDGSVSSSISSIFKLRSKSNISPCLKFIECSISSMDQWPNDSNLTNFPKRSLPIDDNQDNFMFAKYKKRKLNHKFQQLTIKSSTDSDRTEKIPYRLRSKGKLEVSDNSSDQLRHLIEEITKKNPQKSGYFAGEKSIAQIDNKSNGRKLKQSSPTLDQNPNLTHYF